MSTVKAYQVNAHMRPITQVIINRDGDLVFTISKEAVSSLWSFKTGKLIGRYNTVKAALGGGINREATLFAVATGDFSVRIFSVETGELLSQIVLGSPCRAVQFSHDDSKLLVVTDKKMGKLSQIFVFEVPSQLAQGHSYSKELKQAIEPIGDKDTEITCAQWGPTDDYIYYGTRTGSVISHNISNPKDIKTNEVHTKSINRINFDSSYMLLITASDDHTACLLSSKDLNILKSFTTNVPVNEAVISPTADHVVLVGGVAASDVTTTQSVQFHINFYHLVTEKLLGAITGAHFGTITSCAFHPKGTGFVSASVDGHMNIITEFPQGYFSSPGAQKLWSLEAVEKAEEEERIANENFAQAEKESPNKTSEIDEEDMYEYVEDENYSEGYEDPEPILEDIEIDYIDPI